MKSRQRKREREIVKEELNKRPCRNLKHVCKLAFIEGESIPFDMKRLSNDHTSITLIVLRVIFILSFHLIVVVFDWHWIRFGASI